MKALGAGWRRGERWVDFEVVREVGGRSTLSLAGEAGKIANELGVKHIALSITHTAVQALGLTPQLLMPQAFNWFGDDYASSCLNDATCSSEVGIVAGHGYGYPFTPTAFPLAISTGHHLWISETGDQGSYDASMSNALVWAKNIHDWLTSSANVSAVDWWELAYSHNAASVPNGDLTDENFSPAKRFHVEGNWSKFVRPGWVRIGGTANPVGGMYVSAYKDPSSDNFAIVVINQNGTDAPLNFVLNGFPAASVTPWVTSASLDLAQQPSISAGVAHSAACCGRRASPPLLVSCQQ